MADSASSRATFVAAEIVEDHDIALGKRRDEYLLDVEGKEFAVDGSIDDPGGINAIEA